MKSSGCPYCDPLIEELALQRERNVAIERMLRIDAAIARQLSLAMMSNAKLNVALTRIIELCGKDNNGELLIGRVLEVAQNALHP